MDEPLENILHFEIDFEKKGKISQEELQRTKDKARFYYGVSGDSLDDFLDNIQALTCDIQKKLRDEIESRSNLFCACVNGYLDHPLSAEEEESIAHMVRYHIAKTLDENKLDETLDLLAHSMGDFLSVWNENI